jgi:signal transduction histidine kinase
VTSRSKCVVTYELSNLPQLDNYLSNEVWEILKEAIVNAERHSQGTKILISSVVTDSWWTIAVVDNGIGIQTRNKRPDSYGLTGILERAESIGATLVIESPLQSQDYGTSISISLPVNNVEELTNDLRSR